MVSPMGRSPTTRAARPQESNAMGSFDAYFAPWAGFGRSSFLSLGAVVGFLSTSPSPLFCPFKWVVGGFQSLWLPAALFFIGSGGGFSSTSPITTFLYHPLFGGLDVVLVTTFREWSVGCPSPCLTGRSFIIHGPVGLTESGPSALCK